MYGTVTRYLTDRGFGFIRARTATPYFIHHSRLDGDI